MPSATRFRSFARTAFLFLALFAFAWPASAAPPSDSIEAHPPFRLRDGGGDQARGIAPHALTPQGLSPAQVRAVYGLPESGGAGTIAIIEAYDNPNAESDLAAFSAQFGLPSCTTGNGCFEKHKMTGTIPTDSGWILESSLDVQWAHAIAPGAKILLVEARNSTIGNLMAAVDYARARSDVVAVSMSWGVAEFSGEAAYDAHFVSSYGAAFFASSGDSGSEVEWPAVSVNVIGVGGTTLHFSGDTLASETAWSGSGGGRSAYVAAPSYQTLLGVPGADGHRAVPDVSYNADPDSGFSVYDSFGYQGQSGWLVIGGTSAGAPQWAAIHALGMTATLPTLYAAASGPSHATYFRDVTEGTNGACGFFCSAQTGYDYITGLGSPLVADFTVPVTYAEVTEATGGVDVSAGTSAAEGGNGAWTELSGPVITETAANQISAGVHTLTLPAGWEFDTSQAATITIGGASGLTLASPSVTPGANALSFSVTAVSSGSAASLSFSGIRVRPTVTSAPSLGTITHSGAGISGIAGSTSFGALSLVPDVPYSVGVETSADGTGGLLNAEDVPAGGTLTAYAVARDRFGNFVGGQSAAWSLASVTDGVLDADLVPSDDAESAVFTGHLMGSAKIRAAADGLSSLDSGILTVTLGPVTSIALSPQEATTSADIVQAYAVQGNDAYGNSADATLSAAFSISGGAGGSFADGTYTPAAAGTWTVTATLGEATDTALLHVTPGAPAALAFTAQPRSVKASEKLSATVAARDARGNTATAYTGLITLLVQGDAAPLKGVTSAAASGGTVTFDGAYISKTGTGYRLSATASGLASALSDSFSITAARSSGGGGGGSVVSAGASSPAVAGDRAALLSALISQLQALIRTYLAEGGTLDPATQAFVNALASGPAPSGTGAFLRDLGLGSVGEDVRSLQRYLNAHGFPVATSGAGSSGQETTTFGPATQAALQRFEQSAGLLPASGFFDAATRAYVAAHP